MNPEDRQVNFVFTFASKNKSLNLATFNSKFVRTKQKDLPGGPENCVFTKNQKIASLQVLSWKILLDKCFILIS